MVVKIIKLSDWNFEEIRVNQTHKDILNLIEEFNSPVIITKPKFEYTSEEKILECDYDILVSIFDAGFLEI